MSIERYVEQVPADVTGLIQLPIERGPGNFLLFQSSAALVTITLFYDGFREVVANVNAGVYLRRVKPWANMRIDGAIGTSVTYFVGNERNEKDETDIRTQVAVIAGVTAVADQPATNLIDNPVVPCPNAALTQVVPFNAARRRVALSFVSNAVIGAGSVFFRKALGVNNLMEAQAGVLYNFNGTYAISVRNDSGGALNCLIAEET